MTDTSQTTIDVSIQIGILYSKMKRNLSRTQRQNFFSYGLNRLTPQNQTRLEDYITQLAKNNEAAPIPQNPTGKNPKKTVKVKHKKAKNN